MSGEKVACRTPTEGRDGVTNIPAWKFDALRTALRAAIGDEEVPFKGLKDRVRDEMDPRTLEQLGSLGWHMTCVKLELEVRGEIKRLPGSPQRVVWVGA